MNSYSRRLSFGPLEEFVAARHGDESNNQFVHRGPPRLVTDRVISEALGKHHGVVLRWRQLGLTIDAADRAAVSLGVHPSTIWPDFWDDLLLADEMAAAS